MKFKSTKGCLVGDVTPNGPADLAGIKRGDIITKIDGKEITNSSNFRNEVAQRKPGSTVSITLTREGVGKVIRIKLGERPAKSEIEETESGKQNEQSPKLSGLTIQELTPEIAAQLGYGNLKGVLVTHVAGGSPAEDAGLQQGDLILEINRKQITSVKEFKTVLGNLKSGNTAALLIRRGENTFFSALTIP